MSMWRAVVVAAVIGMAAAASAEPIKVRLFTAVEDGGFMTAESRARQDLVRQALAQIAKEVKHGVMEAAEEATITVEIVSIESSGTGTASTVASPLGVALGIPMATAIPQREIVVRAMVRCGDLEHELVSKRITTLSPKVVADRTDAQLFALALRQFLVDNAAKCK